MNNSILADSNANKTLSSLNNIVTLTDIKSPVKILARQLYVVSTWTGRCLAMYIKKGTRIKVG